MKNNYNFINKYLLTALMTAGLAYMAGVAGSSAFAAVSPPAVPISNVPLQLVIPVHPQVLIALGNSQSMDGDLSGAIMTGSGTVTQFNSSSSPLKYDVPDGFTPPVEAADTNNQAAYTVNQNGTLYDNSASRLNLAKASITEVLRDYANDTDFGLMDYSTSGVTRYATWAYYMSSPNGFTFTSDPNASGAPEGRKIVANPCYQSSENTCKNIDNHYADVNVLEQPYLIVADSSDEPEINDVLYAGGQADIFMCFGKRNYSSPFPPNYGIQDYNNGGIRISYSHHVNGAACITGPTNAGFVPYSYEVMDAQRGFGYYDGGVNQKTGKLLVPIESAGDQPSENDIDNYVAKFAPFLAPETDKQASKEIKAGAPQSPVAGIMNGAYDYYMGPKTPPSNNGCGATRYVVLMTDGLPTEDINGKSWPPLGSAAANGYGVKATFNSDGSLSSTNDQALLDAISELNQLKKAGIKTYVVGLGAGVAKSVNPDAYATLQAMAVAGGTGNFFPATSPAAVADELQTILTQIENANLSISAVAVNSTSLRNDTVVYQADFLSQNGEGNWTGNLKALSIDSNSVVGGSGPWQAQTQLDQQDWNTGRIIATYDTNRRGGKGVPFRRGSNYIDTNLSQAQLDYLRGDRTNEQSAGGPFRNRTHILGDIVNSNPLYVGPPSGYSSDPSYSAFLAAHANRTPVIYVGANDGMLHAFDAKTGDERFAYIPNGVFNNLVELTNLAYNQNHRFFVDGSPVATDVKFNDGSWHTLLVGGLNSGGNSIYALDVTDPKAIDSEQALAQHMLWEFTNDTDDKLGKTYSQPVIAQISAGKQTRWVVIFGSGYNNSDGKPYLYVLDAEDGNLLTKIDLCKGERSACDLSLPNGASSPAVVSRSGSPIADTVYVGDLQGNLWRVDISDKKPKKWNDTLLFKAIDAEASPAPQPITTKPAVSLSPDYPSRGGLLVFFGTGKYLGAPDKSDDAIQSFYGIYDRGTGNTVARSSLVQQTITTVNAPDSAIFAKLRTVSNDPVNYSENSGWYMDFPQAGERVVNPPRLADGQLTFTTFAPSPSLCNAGGESFLMVLNYATGGAFPQPEIDLNNDNLLNAQDQVKDRNPVGVGLGKGYAAAVRTIRTQKGDIGTVALANVTPGGQKAVKLRGNGERRASWRQIR